MPVAWTQYNKTTVGQIVRKSYVATVTGGQLFKETVSILSSGNQSKVSGAGTQQTDELVIAEASCFVAGATTNLTYVTESTATDADLITTVYSAVEATSGITVYLSITIQEEVPGKVNGAMGNLIPKAASMSIATMPA